MSGTDVSVLAVRAEIVFLFLAGPCLNCLTALVVLSTSTRETDSNSNRECLRFISLDLNLKMKMMFMGPSSLPPSPSLSLPLVNIPQGILF